MIKQNVRRIIEDTIRELFCRYTEDEERYCIPVVGEGISIVDSENNKTVGKINCCIYVDDDYYEDDYDECEFYEPCYNLVRVDGKFTYRENDGEIQEEILDYTMH